MIITRLRHLMIFDKDDIGGGGDPPPEDKNPPASTEDTPPKKTPEVKENTVDLDYSKFDGKLNEKTDPNNLTSKAFAEKAKELGISVKAAKTLFSTVDSSITSSLSQFEEKASERCKASLEERWGDKFEVNNNALKRGVLKLTEGDDNLKKELETSGAFDNPLVAELISKVGHFFKEELQDTDHTSTFDEKDPYGFAKNDKKR